MRRLTVFTPKCGTLHIWRGRPPPTLSCSTFMREWQVRCSIPAFVVLVLCPVGCQFVLQDSAEPRSRGIGLFSTAVVLLGTKLHKPPIFYSIGGLEKALKRDSHYSVAVKFSCGRRG